MLKRAGIKVGAPTGAVDVASIMVQPSRSSDETAETRIRFGTVRMQEYKAACKECQRL